MNFLKRPQSYLISLFALLVLFMPARPSVQAATQQNYAEIKPGIQVLLEDSLHLVKDKRVGLVTNQTGVDSKGSSSIDLIFSHPQVDLIALFSPEHGIRGDLDPGEEVEDGVDPRTGLPIYSLYGNTRKPTSEMLEDVEVLLVDLQDIGARYWTYISTMTLSMEAAFENGIPVVV
ncbi:MAG: exo-beta-N-acetylmuramidase NamZ domain-containing protein, partial [bacterium]